MATSELLFRDGSTSDLPLTFALGERARQADGGAPEPTEVELHADWLARRPFVEYLAAQPDGRYLIAEDAAGPVGYVRVVRFGGMEQLTELTVSPDHRGLGIGRRLLELAWSGDPTAELGRVVVAPPGANLSGYLQCGVMPVGGHWELTVPRERYLERRSHELEDSRPAVHALKRDRAAAEWKRLEPPAIAHSRPWLHDFFGRDRTCLARLDERTGAADALCWVSSDSEIGPAVAARPGGLVPVVVAALDRVAMSQQPEQLCVSATTLAWWLLRRLAGLEFTVSAPGWILCSVPLPGLDRYVPSRPAQVL